MAFNYSTTWNDAELTDFEPTSMFTSISSLPESKGPKGSKGSKGIAGWATDSEKSTLKQSLLITALILITIVIIGSIISWIQKTNREYMRVQWETKVGRFFLISFCIALCAFYINAITMSYFILNVEDITIGERPWLMCFGKIPYQIGRLIMELFFILRLHFIFGDSAKAINKYILLILIIISFCGFICGCIATLSSKSIYDWWQYDPKTASGQVIAPQFSFASTLMASFVSMFVMYLYIKILYEINEKCVKSEIEMQDKRSFVDNSSTTGATPSTTTTSPDGETSNIKMNVSVTLQISQMRLIRNITKNTLLGISGLASTFMLNFKNIYEWIVDARPDPTLWRCLASFDGAINIVTMYLIFSWTTKQYDKLCYQCHHGMQKCCVWCTKRSIIKKGMGKI